MEMIMDKQYHRIMARWTRNPQYDVERDWTGFMGHAWNTKNEAVEEIAQQAGIDVEERWENWRDPDWRSHHIREHDNYGEFIADLAEEIEADVRYHEMAGQWVQVHHEGLEGYYLDAGTLREALKEIADAVTEAGGIDAVYPWSGIGDTTEGENIRYLGAVPGYEDLHLFAIGSHNNS
jgi:hypothetical protein